jgi:23S rRNA pseudouridine2605 synthase
MTEYELHQARREKWRLAGEPVRTLEEARAFIESTGICLMYPVKPPLLAPTFIGAYAGDDEHLPTLQHAFADPRAQEATELMVRLLREKAAFEANLFGETNFLVAASVFPYLYGLVGDHNPRQTVKPGKHSEYSPLARDVFEAIRTHGKISKPRLREALGGDPSGPALDRALHELWSKLRITRVDYTREEGASWDALLRWAPEPVRRGLHMSAPEALSALVSKYLDGVVAAEQTEVEEFFSHLVPRSRVREAINALLSARELSFVTVGKKTMLQITPRRQEYVAQPRRKA